MATIFKTSIHLRRVKNLSTGTELLAQKGHQFEVTECSGLVLIFMSRVRPVKGNLLQLLGDICFDQEKHVFDGTARVLEAPVEMPGGLFRFKVQWSQIDKDLWARFLQRLEKSQERVDEIFLAIQGGE